MNSTPMIDVNEIPPVGGHNYVDEGIEDAEVYGTPARTAPAGFASPARERFRLIALRLDAQLGQRAHKTLVVTSPGSGDGKTTTALHLGASLARDLGKRVIVVDADLRRPRLARPLGLEVTKGLGDVLTGQARLDDILWRVGDDPLYIVPGSPEGHGPMALRGLPPVLENLRNRA